MTAVGRQRNRIKRSRFEMDEEFVKALRDAGKTKEAERYIARKPGMR